MCDMELTVNQINKIDELLDLAYNKEIDVLMSLPGKAIPMKLRCYLGMDKYYIDIRSKEKKIYWLFRIDSETRHIENTVSPSIPIERSLKMGIMAVINKALTQLKRGA